MNEAVTYKDFEDVLNKRGKELKTTSVVLTYRHSMLGLAHYLARTKRETGILNPSDARAIRQGSMGMSWLGGSIRAAFGCHGLSPSAGM